MSVKVRAASLAAIPPGSGLEVTVADRVIAIFNVGGRLHAVDGICPHAGGPLGAGALSGSVVTCPWHGWQFDVTTGQHCLNPRLCQSSYPVHVEGDSVFVEVPE